MNIEIHPNFKKQAIKSIWAIVLFVIVYTLLITFSLGLTVLCFYFSYYIVKSAASWLTVMIAIGLISVALTIIYFLVKFIFKRHKSDLSHFVEITPDDQPKLFSLIHEIVNEVQTDFPKKVYLSAEVNASVFYDSSILSMFLPIRKNLQIGMALINAVTHQELKAILAHEFGHFSQRSMKVGSYVYNVNKVIYDMLDDNEALEDSIQSFANTHIIFTIFVGISIKIINLIQFILRKVYDIVNINYLGLSREMEFHADAISAHVAGSKALKEALPRLDLADFAYNAAINNYYANMNLKKRSKNIFDEQLFLMKFTAEKHKLVFKNDLPLVSINGSGLQGKSRIEIEDQWASHPSIKDRIQALDKLNITLEHTNDSPANSLIENRSKLELTMTDKLFKNDHFPIDSITQDLNDFTKKYIKEYNENSFDDRYNGYYNAKNPVNINFDAFETSGDVKNFEDLFCNEIIELSNQNMTIQQDLELLSFIENSQIKSFDFNGYKHKSSDAFTIKSKLKEEADIIERKIADHDKEIYLYFNKKAEQKNCMHEFKEKYRNYCEEENIFEKKNDLQRTAQEASNFILQVTPLDEIRSKLAKFIEYEKIIKMDIGFMVNDESIQNDITESMRTNFNNYLKSNLEYFNGENYHQTNLDILGNAMNDYDFLLFRKMFHVKKKFLNYQIALLD